MFFYEILFNAGGKARSGSSQTRFWFANEMEKEKQEVKILWRSAHRSWREFVCLQRDKTVARILGNNLESCLACCGILEIFQKYPTNIREILRICQKKMPRVVLFVLRRAVPRRNIKGSPLAGRPHSFTFQHQYWTRGLSTWSGLVLCIYITFGCQNWTRGHSRVWRCPLLMIKEEYL